MKNNQGNVFFLILIAVALFAMVSYSLSSGGPVKSDLSDEEAELAISDMFQYHTRIKQVVRDLRMLKECADTEISFHYDSDGDGILETDGQDDYYNPNAPADFSCHVFDVRGGGLSYKAPDIKLLDPAYATAPFAQETVFATSRLGGSADPTMGTAESDLVIFVGYATERICNLYTERLGHHDYIAEDNDLTLAAPYFVGAYPSYGDMDQGPTRTQDKLFGGCVQGRAPFSEPSYVLYHLLIER